MLPVLREQDPIIMVDDNEGDIFLAYQCFQQASLKHGWLSFDNGRDFLAHLDAVKQGDERMPALVLLDVNMPGMSGLDVLERVRQDDHFKSLPIMCMLTTSTDPRDRERAARLGASDFITKPDSLNAYVRLFQAFGGV
jgi:CheY-like chemotaxis protein